MNQRAVRAAPALRAHQPATGAREHVVAGGKHFSAVNALPQFGAETGHAEQSRLEVSCHLFGTLGGFQYGQRVDEQAELGGVDGAIGGEGVYQFREIQPSRDEAEVFAHGSEARHGLGFDHLIETAPLRHRDADVGEGLEESALAALGAAGTLDDRADLAPVGGVEGDDAVGLAEPHVRQDDALGVVCLRSRQGCFPDRAEVPERGDARTPGGLPVPVRALLRRRIQGRRRRGVRAQAASL